jgi:hypothetical protein
MSPVTIMCPVCGVPPGKACQTEKGEKLPRFHHERIDTARAQEDQVNVQED